MNTQTSTANAQIPKIVSGGTAMSNEQSANKLKSLTAMSYIHSAACQPLFPRAIRFLMIIGMIALGILTTGCGENLGSKTDRSEAGYTEKGRTVSATVSGTVLDKEGNPVAGSIVHIGKTAASTNDEGFFAVSGKHFDEKRTIITVKKDGYLPTIKTVPMAENGDRFVNLTLLEGDRSSFGAVDGTTDLSLDNGKIILDFPQNGLVRENGTPYSGEVTVVGKYIDPKADNFGKIIPGNLDGINDEGDEVGLISYGMADIELEDENGNPLQVAAGSTVEITMPYVEGGPDTIPLWYFNEDKGIWIEDGSAQRVGDMYVGEVSHFTKWNLDIAFNGKELTVHVFDLNGNTVQGAVIQIHYNGNQVGGGDYHTDDDGTVTFFNIPDTDITVWYGMNSATSEFGPTDIPFNSTHIYVTLDTQTLNLGGIVNDCGGIPLGDADVYFSVVSNTGEILFASHQQTNGNQISESFQLDGNSDDYGSLRIYAVSGDRWVSRTLTLIKTNGVWEPDPNHATLQNGVYVLSGTSDGCETRYATQWESVFPLGSRTLAVGIDGSLWGWGYNEDGKLGSSLPSTVSRPMPINNDVAWKHIAEGTTYNSAAGISNSGELWIWDEGTGFDESPRQIGIDAGWQTISATTYSHFALKGDGTIWKIGNTDVERIGSSNDWKSISAGRIFFSAIKNDGTLWFWRGGPYTNLRQEGTATDWKKVVEFGSFGFALKTDGSIWYWLTDDYHSSSPNNLSSPRQLGTDNDWKSISIGGHYYVLAVKNNGTLWYLGNGDEILSSYCCKFDSSAYIRERIGTDNDWDRMFDRHGSFAVKSDGSVWAFGRNGHGQLGDGTLADKLTPVRVSFDN